MVLDPSMTITWTQTRVHRYPLAMGYTVTPWRVKATPELRSPTPREVPSAVCALGSGSCYVPFLPPLQGPRNSVQLRRERFADPGEKSLVDGAGGGA